MSLPSIPLRFWLPGSVLLAFGLLLGGLSWLQLSEFRTHILRDAETQVSIQGHTLQHHLEKEIRRSSLDEIQDEFTLIASIPEVSACAIVDPQGNILAGNRLEWRHGAASLLPGFNAADSRRVQATNRAFRRWVDEAHTLTYYLPISLPSQGQLRPGVGVLFISYDNSERLAQAWNHALQRFFLILGGGLCILVGLIWTMRHRLLSPLRRLAQAQNAFGEGQLQVRVDLPRDPDLAHLARSFNAMAEHQQQLLAELSRSQENLSATLDSIGDGVIVTDHLGRITRMNGVAEAITAWTLEEARGRNIEDVMMLVDNQRERQVVMPVRQVLQTGQVVYLANHTKLIRRDGQEVHIADSAAPIRSPDGQIGGVVMVCRDVNQEYALREALREQEMIYRLMAEQSVSFDYWLDPGGRFRYIAPSCERITGYTVAQFMGTPNFLEGITHPDDRHLLRRHTENVRNPGTTPHSMEFRIIDRGGQVRWLHHLCQDMYAEDGTWLGRRASNMDITERKDAQDGLALQASELQELVDERTRQLQGANAALTQASRAKDEFLAAMSHELRTPLTAILGMTELLRESAQGPLNPKQLRHVRQIEESGRHLLELINDILDVAKIEAGQLGLQAGEVKVAKVVEASLAMVREAARAKNLRLSLAEDGRVARLQGDPRRIKQALVNLLSNAVKFTPEGGQIGLEIMGNDHDKLARFTVWDTGIGISPEDQARLFHPFTQVDASLGREYTGTGLGLVLVKSMIELHKGRIEVQSEPGKGSRFSFTLPWDPDAVRDAPAEVASLPSPAPAPGAQGEQSRRILLVDDNEVNREMAREFLEIGGHTVRTADDGQQALEMLQSDPLPDLVLLDIQMPVLDGPSTLARMRQDPRTARLPVVALTALAMSGDRDRLLAQGFNAYLAKPYQIDTLLQVVRDTPPAE